ncbi:MAG: hypothetical protein ACFCU1_12900 [Sumerlaeia bacterium]
MNPIVRSLLIFSGILVVCLVLFFVVRPAVSKSRALSSLDETGRDRYEQWALQPVGINPAELSVTLPSADFEEEKKRLFDAWNKIAVLVNTHQQALIDIAKRKQVVLTDDVSFLADFDSYINQLQKVVQHPDYALEELNFYSSQSEVAMATLPVIQHTRTILFVRGLNALATGNNQGFVSATELLIQLASNHPYATTFVNSLRWSILDRAVSLARLAQGIPAAKSAAEQLRPQFAAVIESMKLLESADETSLDHVGIVRMLVKQGELNALPAITETTNGEELFRMAVLRDDASTLQAARSYAITYGAMNEIASQRRELLRNLEYLVTQ